MYQDFDEKVKPSIIVLSDLKSIDSKNFYSLYDVRMMSWEKEEEFPNKSKEEIDKEIKKEIKENVNKLKEETIKDKYYQLNSEKIKEIEQKFKQIKLKANFNSKPKILRDGKFYTISQGYFTIYNDKYLNKLYEIKLEENKNITSAIQLDNKDLVIFAKYQLIIYRLKNEKYYLFQKIDENSAGFQQQSSYSGCMAYPKIYESEFIKEISGNRFILVSNYGFKIYSLNEKNEYFISSLERYHEGLKTIHELDKNTFIFCSEISCGASLGGPAHNVLVIDKIHLREITKDEIANKLTKLKERDYDDDDFFYGNSKTTKKITDEEKKNVIESLKLTHYNREFIEYSTYGGHHYFRGNAILKNKYFVSCIDSNILIFDIISGKLLKRYKLVIEGEDNLYVCKGIIRKWNNNEDNEFLINIRGNIILFELNDNGFKIISQTYFQHINGLKKLNDNNNSFYDDGENEDYYSSPYYFYHSSSNGNKNCNVSIFY